METDITPPEAPERGSTAEGNAPPAVSSFARLETLKMRADFLLAAQGRRARMPGLALQARRRQDGSSTIRVGFTCSKKVGNAVARNRAKRRLREVARQVLPGAGRPGWDYVLIGLRQATAERPFAALTNDLCRALDKVHAP